MVRLSGWLRQNYDGAITLVVVGVAIVLGLLNVLSTQPIDQAILIVLGLLAYTILRERQRTDRVVQQPQAVRLLGSDEIRTELSEARRRTSQWTFKGGTGTYLRAVTLPDCIGYAEARRRNFRIQAEIVDPTNETVCEYYANMRRHSRPDGTAEPWTPIRTRNESYATILAACWYQQRHATLTIDVALSSTVPTFRWDLSSDRVFITQEDPSPHLMFSEPSPHYNFCTRELDSSFKQATRVRLDQGRKVHLSEQPTVDETRRLFAALDTGLDAIGDRDVEQIIQRALKPRNPYP